MGQAVLAALDINGLINAYCIEHHCRLNLREFTR